MSNISQSGNYRGLVLDRGLSKSSSGCLQMVATLQATEKYNADAQVWEPFNYEDCEAQAYLNLVTRAEKENPVNCKQIMRAFGWDGMSFAALNDPNNDLAKQIQWQMGMETYNEVERCKVQGIAAYDAAPGRQVEKLDAADVRKLDAQYAGILKNLGGGPKPKTAGKPTAPPQAPVSPDPTPAPLPGTPTATASPTPTPSTAPEPAPAKPKRGRPAAPKTPPAPPQDTADPMTQEEAWGVYADKAQAAGKHTDLEIQQAWLAVLHENYNGDESSVGENWSPVAEAASKRLGL